MMRKPQYLLYAHIMVFLDGNPVCGLVDGLRNNAMVSEFADLHGT